VSCNCCMYQTNSNTWAPQASINSLRDTRRSTDTRISINQQTNVRHTTRMHVSYPFHTDTKCYPAQVESCLHFVKEHYYNASVGASSEGASLSKATFYISVKRALRTQSSFRDQTSTVRNPSLAGKPGRVNSAARVERTEMSVKPVSITRLYPASRHLPLLPRHHHLLPLLPSLLLSSSSPPRLSSSFLPHRERPSSSSLHPS